MRLAGLVEFNHRTALTVPPRGPAVLIANHPTLIDVTALVSALGPTCYLAKRSLFHNPLIGPLLRLCGQIPSGGRTLAGNVGSLNEALDRLQRGHSVLLFPEGTRSPAGGLHTFRRGAFELARRAGVPVIPIVIRAEPPGLYRGLAWYEIPSRPIVIDMEILDPISATVATPTLASDLIRRRLGLPASGEPAARR